MVNKPKKIGTEAETGVLKKILPYFPTAERLVLHGDRDQGDIAHCGDFIFEVKGGAQAKQFGDGQLAKWMEEAQKEAGHRGVRFGVLVTARAGFSARENAHRWWAWLRIEDFAEIAGGFYRPGRFATVRLELCDLLELLADQGYTPNVGEPATDLVLAPMTTPLPVPDALTAELTALGLPAPVVEEVAENDGAA